MRTSIILAALVSLTACQLQRVDAESTAAAITKGSPEEAAVLALTNDPQIDEAILDGDVGLDRRAARGIIAHRNGADGLAGTADDQPFVTIDELDAIAYVGPSALSKLLAFARAHGYVPGTEAPTAEELDYATLALVNDPSVTVDELDDAVGLDNRAARNIIRYRNGLDGIPATADDRTFMTLAELDAISYVGDTALGKLRDYAVEQGYLDQVPKGSADVLFSPQSYYESHVIRVVEKIEAAQHSIDIAMYSFSDEGIFGALEDAVDRGVSVRFLFETAAEDRKKTGSALDSTRSARLERMGIDVRWVNKIMHHKFAIIDGPRTDLAAAATATVITGSGNWSYGAATQYDENTLFLTGHAETTLRLQQEFNHLWDHARDLAYASFGPITAIAITDADIEAVDTPAADALFTSDNFNVSGDTFSIVTGRNTVSDRMVQAIENATDSIWIASGHLRSRPIAEALMAKAAANPTIDIRVYLDGQEYISRWYHSQQLADLDDCVAAAGTSASRLRSCYDKGFLFGYQVGEAGIAVRYKYYAYRWDYTYAKQMHNKWMVVDGDELWTGSYNLSDNAEHNTFENMLVFRGLPYAALIQRYVEHFEVLWNTARDDGSYDAVMSDVATGSSIPLVFDPMALTWAEIEALKSSILTSCPAVNSDDYRQNPADHRTCPRL